MAEIPSPPPLPTTSPPPAAHISVVQTQTAQAVEHPQHELPALPTFGENRSLFVSGEGTGVSSRSARNHDVQQPAIADFQKASSPVPAIALTIQAVPKQINFEKSTGESFDVILTHVLFVLFLVKLNSREDSHASELSKVADTRKPNFIYLINLRNQLVTTFRTCLHHPMNNQDSKITIETNAQTPEVVKRHLTGDTKLKKGTKFCGPKSTNSIFCKYVGVPHSQITDIQENVPTTKPKVALLPKEHPAKKRKKKRNNNNNNNNNNNSVSSVNNNNNNNKNKNNTKFE